MPRVTKVERLSGELTNALDYANHLRSLVDANEKELVTLRKRLASLRATEEAGVFLTLAALAEAMAATTQLIKESHGNR